MKKNFKIISIIPARGGSKRIPKKNIRLLNGKPLIAYSIELSLRCENIDRTIVSTDDPDIARIAKDYGAEVLLRSNELSGDLISTEPVMLDILKQLKVDNYDPDYVVLLQPTTPLRSLYSLNEGLKLILGSQADTLLSVCEIPHYYLSGHFEKGDYCLDYKSRPFSQTMEKKYRENGALYITKKDFLLKHENRIGGKIKAIVMNEIESIDIDEPKDFELAEQMMSFYQKETDYGNLIIKSIPRLGAKANCHNEFRKLIPLNISALFFDFDGVFTDNKVYLDQNGKESVLCDRSDGMGLHLLRNKMDFPVFVISTEKNEVTLRRCEKLGIKCYHGIDNKLALLKKICQEQNIDSRSIIYVGNDVNDYECLEFVGCGVVVADAHESVLSVANMVLKRSGGDGAIRELCDLIINRNQSNE